MKIYTSYFAIMNTLPEGCIPVSIARHTPKWYAGVCCPEIAPTASMIRRWKEDSQHVKYTKDDYLVDYVAILDRINPKAFVAWLESLGGYSVALLCYEKPDDFCHRHLVADWLHKNGFSCEEF